MRPKTASNSRSYSQVNPFNPYDAYMKLSDTTLKPNQILNTTMMTNKHTKTQLLFEKTNSHLPAMIRNIQNKGLRSQNEFDGFIRRLNKSKQKSVQLLQNTKEKITQSTTDLSEMVWQKSKEQLFLEYLVEQEQKIKHQGLDEQKEFMNYREKQMRVLQIKSFVQKTKKIRLQNEIDDLLKDTNTKGSKSFKVKYLSNEHPKQRKLLEKPLFFGIMFDQKQKKQVVQSYKPPLPLDFINLQLSNHEKQNLILTLYGKKSQRQNLIIQNNENYRELMQQDVYEKDQAPPPMVYTEEVTEENDSQLDDVFLETCRIIFMRFTTIIENKFQSTLQDAFLELQDF